MIEIPRGDEIGKSEELKRLQVEVLKKRVREPLRKLDDIFKILGPHSPYYVFILTMNAIMFAVLNHFNEMDQFLIYSDEDVVYSDERGRIIAPEYPSVINQYGQYATSNGAMDLTTLTILTNISSMAGCFVALLIAKWSFHKTIVTFAVIIVISFLISQAFLFNFFDRITFFVGSVFSKALSIVTLQAAFESGQGKYRVVAIGFCFYLNNFIVFITLLLFKKDRNYAETHYMFIITGLTALYTL
uniref:Sugar transporter n=1 Tax=Caenorhabditis tropicalis TaxID=1561998 RepID=A0A1I7TQV0_9PELO